MPIQHLFRALIQYRRPRAIRERADHCALHCIVGRDDDPLPVGWMCVEERREMRNQLRRYDNVLDFVEPNVITGWLVGRRHCFASARRPASVIVIRTTSNVRSPAIMCSGVAIASPAMHRSTICSTVKPCASMIASVAPLGEDASSSSARRRSGFGTGLSSGYGYAAALVATL